MKKIGLILSSVLVFSMLPFQVNAEEVSTEMSKTSIQQEIEQAIQEQVAYHVREYEQLESPEEKLNYIESFSDVDDETSAFSIQSIEQKDVPSETTAKEIFEQTLDNAYVYTMDDAGNVYDKTGDVVNQLNLNTTSQNQTESLISENSVSALAANRVLGDTSGAFARQVTRAGYKGISTTLTLPLPANFSVTGAATTGYLYNGIDVKPTSGGYKIEAGFQYSPDTQGYTASIHPQGQDQNAFPTGPADKAGKVPPRYKPGTSVVSNLMYDTASGQYKYFVNGTNVNGANQYIYFYYPKTLDASDLSAMHVKRVVALAKNNYASTNIGKVRVQYTASTLTNTAGTQVALNSVHLDTITSGTSIYGTADWPSNTVTKSPATGSIASQLITLDTTSLPN